MCDLTGKERRVDVRFLCSDDPIHIKAIEEIVSCQYVIVVGTPAMCSEVLGTIHGAREKVRPLPLFLSYFTNMILLHKHESCCQNLLPNPRVYRMGSTVEHQSITELF
jgi:hypothetical protein